MTSRPLKAAVVFMLGFALVWQGVFAASTGINPNAGGAKTSCCCTGCDFKHCSTPACCAKPNAPSDPVVPASLPSPTQNEFHALAASLVSLLTLPSLKADELPFRSSSLASQTAIPLFQRNCCYLI